MHHFKTFGLLSCSPLIYSSLTTCRIAPVLQQQQCPAPWADFRSTGRSHFSSQTSRTAHTSALQSSITYRIGAAFSAKGRKFNTKKDLFSFDSSRQSSEKPPYTGRPASGQDAFFVSNVGNGRSIAFGVADGVGGWIDSGVDPADFSHGLCQYLTQNAQDHGEERLGARELLEKGYKDLVADKSIPAGGSTACVAIADTSGQLEVAKYVSTRPRSYHAVQLYTNENERQLG